MFSHPKVEKFVIDIYVTMSQKNNFKFEICFKYVDFMIFNQNNQVPSTLRP